MDDATTLATGPKCVVCDTRPQPDGRQVCHPCEDSLAADLDAFFDLAALIPSAVAPHLPQPLTVGSRSTEVSLPGGDALNLTAGSNPEVRLRFIPHVRTLREVTLVEVPGYRPIEHSEFRREQILNELTGRPELVPDGDQCGDLGPWVMVARWTADWAQLRDVGEVGVPGVGWLRERLDWACRAHPDVGGWAGELRSVVNGMRAVLDVKPHRVRYKDRCPRCDASATLYRLIDPMLPADDRRVMYVNCGACGTMFDLDDERIDGGPRDARPHGRRSTPRPDAHLRWTPAV